MLTPKQGGTTDCGLYAIAIATSLAYGIDPSQLIFDQQEMRCHFVDCLSSQSLKPFPVRKKLRVTNPIKAVAKIYLCPACNKQDLGGATEMVGCDKSSNWFHHSCVAPYYDDPTEKWYCSRCAL